MKITMLAAALAVLGLLSGCSQGPMLEHPELSPPSETALIGTYKIVEETVSGKSSSDNAFAATRLELLASGKAQFVDFPLFDHRRGVQGLPRKTTCGGHWLTSSAQSGYQVTLDPDNENRIQAVIVEGGALIIYYAPRTEGYFTKWSKTP